MSTASKVFSFSVRVLLRSAPSAAPTERDLPLVDLRDPALLDALEPVRVVRAVERMRSRARFQPVLSLGRAVACESRMEALRVAELDRAGSLVWVVAQPFWILEHANGRVSRRHVPDLLYGLEDGSVVLENVRPPERRTPAFAEQEAMCAYVAGTNGWSYRTVGAYVGASAAVLDYLWQYAVVEPRADVVARVAEAFRVKTVWGLQALVARCGRHCVAYPSLMALAWRGELALDAAAGVSARTPVRLGAGFRA